MPLQQLHPSTLLVLDFIRAHPGCVRKQIAPAIPADVRLEVKLTNLRTLGYVRTERIEGTRCCKFTAVEGCAEAKLARQAKRSEEAAARRREKEAAATERERHAAGVQARRRPPAAPKEQAAPGWETRWRKEVTPVAHGPIVPPRDVDYRKPWPEPYLSDRGLRSSGFEFRECASRRGDHLVYCYRRDAR